MKLTFPQLDQLVNQARAQAPREACGIIGGRNGRALKLFPLPNNDLQPLVRYNAEPNALLNALREIEENGWEHIAIYHSHPASPGYPSPTDIARAFYPETAYLVISLADPEQALVRGFRIVEGEVKEITLEVEDEDESSRTNSRRAARGTGRPRSRVAVASLSKRRPGRGNAGGARRGTAKKV